MSVKSAVTGGTIHVRIDPIYVVDVKPKNKLRRYEIAVLRLGGETYNVRAGDTIELDLTLDLLPADKEAL